jgi:hypothetical protein
MRRKAKEFLLIYVFASIAYGLFALILAFPFHPITSLGWVIWFVVALPIVLFGEAVGSAIFNRRIGEAIGGNSDHLSVGRVAYGVVAALLFLTIILFFVWLLDLGWGDFWNTHFSKSW